MSKTHTSIEDAFAARLADAMQDAGIVGSLREKALKLGVSKSFLDGMLKGIKLPGRKNSLKIAAICGVREAWLMEGLLPRRSPALPKITIEHWSAEDQDALLTIWKSIETKYKRPKN